MTKLIISIIVIFACVILFLTCQDSLSPDKVATDTGSFKIPDIKTCEPPPPPENECGRMTGGGSVFTDENVRVTRGFEIHCDLSKPNNLEINWKGGKKFHLTTLTYAECYDDPEYDMIPPEAPFDTFIGEGIGKLNKLDGATISFRFEDHGEPGKNDVAMITIWEPGNPVPVLFVEGPMHNGNLQAHDDKDCE